MYNNQQISSMLFILVTSIIVIAFPHCDASDLSVTIPDVGTLLYSTTESTWSSNIIYQFQGVRFAESPINNRRFKVCVDGTVRQFSNCATFGHSCIRAGVHHLKYLILYRELMR